MRSHTGERERVEDERLPERGAARERGAEQVGLDRGSDRRPGPLEQRRNRQPGRLARLRWAERDKRVTALGIEDAAAVPSERKTTGARAAPVAAPVAAPAALAVTRPVAPGAMLAARTCKCTQRPRQGHPWAGSQDTQVMTGRPSGAVGASDVAPAGARPSPSCRHRDRHADAHHRHEGQIEACRSRKAGACPGGPCGSRISEVAGQAHGHGEQRSEADLRPAVAEHGAREPAPDPDEQQGAEQRPDDREHRLIADALRAPGAHLSAPPRPPPWSASARTASPWTASHRTASPRPA